MLFVRYACSPRLVDDAQALYQRPLNVTEVWKCTFEPKYPRCAESPQLKISSLNFNNMYIKIKTPRDLELRCLSLWKEKKNSVSFLSCSKPNFDFRILLKP